MNPELEKIAQKVLDKLPKESTDKYGIVIITILMIISITLTVIRIIQECNKKRLLGLNKKQKCQLFNIETKSLSMKRSFFTRMTLRRVIRKELPRDAYKKYGNDLMNAILDTGVELTEEETQTLVEAANV